MLKYVYLTSLGFSGSTLLSFMLGSHSRIATVGEVSNTINDGDPENYKCSCGQLMRECPFWNNASMKMQGKHQDFSYKNFGTKLKPRKDTFIDRLQMSNLRSNAISNIRDYIYGKFSTYNNYTSGIMKRNINLANTILDITGKNVFFDASKNPNRIAFLKKYLECELKVIHLVKDGRGFMDSWKRRKPNGSDITPIITWKKINRFAQRSLKYVKKENRYTLLYRDLAKEPEDTLAKLCDFIGVDFESTCLNFRNCEHHIIGNAMRHGSGNDIYYDEKWRTGLTREQLKLFERRAGKLNREFGYSS